MVVITEDETILLRVQSYKTTKYETRRRGLTILTHLSRMNFPISISRTSLFYIYGCLVVFLIVIQLLIDFLVSKEWRPLLDTTCCGQCLIWVSTVCLRLTGALGLYGLT